MKLDDKDLKIIELLKEHSDYSSRQIAKKLLIPVTTAHHRVRRLKQEGIIKKFTVELDNKKLGKVIAGYIMATVEYKSSSGKKLHQEDIAKKVKALPQVEEVCIMTGHNDLVIKFVARDVEDLNEMVIDKLRTIEGIDKTQTMITLKRI